MDEAARRREATARFHERMARAFREHGRERDAEAAERAAALARTWPESEEVDQ